MTDTEETKKDRISPFMEGTDQLPIGIIMRIARELQGETQMSLSKALNISPYYLTTFETCKRPLEKEDFTKIVKHLTGALQVEDPVVLLCAHFEQIPQMERDRKIRTVLHNPLMEYTLWKHMERSGSVPIPILEFYQNDKLDGERMFFRKTDKEENLSRGDLCVAPALALPIRTIRRYQNRTQANVAEKAGLTVDQVAALENYSYGNVDSSRFGSGFYVYDDVVQKIAQGLGMHPNEPDAAQWIHNTYKAVPKEFREQLMPEIKDESPAAENKHVTRKNTVSARL
jgi:transcriptional regulator with XRE-family HTH domain